MNRTRIPYGDFHLPIQTGCLHSKDICACHDECWARKYARRGLAPHLYNVDFLPQWNWKEWEAPLLLKNPSIILVAFTGDLFGDWMSFIAQERVLEIVRKAPRHTYIFLTKNPSALAQHNPWPKNCFVGMTLTGAESLERQEQMVAAFAEVEGHRWLSYEPVLGELQVNIEGLVDFVIWDGLNSKEIVKPECIRELPWDRVFRKTDLKLLQFYRQPYWRLLEKLVEG